MENRRIRFVLELPDPEDFRYTNHNPPRERGARVQHEAHDQACRQRCRALLLVIKTKLGAVSTGIATIKTKFLANIVLPDNTTAGEWMLPRLIGPTAPARCRLCCRPPGIPTSALPVQYRCRPPDGLRRMSTFQSGGWQILKTAIFCPHSTQGEDKTMVSITPASDDFPSDKSFVLVFVIGSLERGTSDIYQAARGGCKMRAVYGPPVKYRGLVLARDPERIIGAFRPRRCYSDPTDGGRWYFDGEPADFATQRRYVGRAVPYRWRNGRNPFRYCDPQSS